MLWGLDFKPQCSKVGWSDFYLSLKLCSKVRKGISRGNFLSYCSFMLWWPNHKLTFQDEKSLILDHSLHMIKIVPNSQLLMSIVQESWKSFDCKSAETLSFISPPYPVIFQILLLIPLWELKDPQSQFRHFPLKAIFPCLQQSQSS